MFHWFISSQLWALRLRCCGSEKQKSASQLVEFFLQIKTVWRFPSAGGRQCVQHGNRTSKSSDESSQRQRELHSFTTTAPPAGRTQTVCKTQRATYFIGSQSSLDWTPVVVLNSLKSPTVLVHLNSPSPTGRRRGLCDLSGLAWTRTLFSCKPRHEIQPKKRNWFISFTRILMNFMRTEALPLPGSDRTLIDDVNSVSNKPKHHLTVYKTKQAQLTKTEIPTNMNI